MIESVAPARLLDDDEPQPFEVERRDGASPFVISCDHAGRRLPRRWARWGWTDDLQRHIAWDIGARGVALRLAAALDAFVACQRYSRLVIDCNRQLGHVDSIATQQRADSDSRQYGDHARAGEARAREIFGRITTRFAASSIAGETRIDRRS